jgi:hypothetical protein
MSSSGYSVTIKIKDDGTLKQLQKLQNEGLRISSRFEEARRGSAIEQMGAPGEPGKAPIFNMPASAGGDDNTFKKMEDLSKDTEKQTGIFQKMADLGGLQLLKLIGIGAGIAGVLAATIKSSGMLQGLLKLWELGMILFLRPIGDFIALSLRPLTLMFMSLAAPYFKEMAKWAREWGPKIGKALVEGEPLANPVFGTDLPNKEDYDQFFANFAVETGKFFAGLKLPSFEEIGTVWSDFLTNTTATLSSIPSEIGKVFTELGENIWNWLQNVPQIVSTSFVQLGNQLLQFFVDIPHNIAQLFFTLGDQLGAWFGDVPHMIFSAFETLSHNIGAALADVPQLIRSAIEGAIAGARGSLVSGSLAALPGISKHAKGGIINEPVLGFGQVSGRGYLFGEAGAERITPLSGGGTSTASNKTFNINMNVSGPIDAGTMSIERAKLRAMMASMGDLY